MRSKGFDKQAGGRRRRAEASTPAGLPVWPEPYACPGTPFGRACHPTPSDLPDRAVREYSRKAKMLVRDKASLSQVRYG